MDDVICSIYVKNKNVSVLERDNKPCLGPIRDLFYMKRMPVCQRELELTNLSDKMVISDNDISMSVDVTAI